MRDLGVFLFFLALALAFKLADFDQVAAFFGACAGVVAACEVFDVRL